MELTVKTKITVQSSIKAPIEKVWKCWTSADDIINWYSASEDWHTPKAENNFINDGKFNYRMEAKDGSFGFNLEGIFTTITLNKLIEYKLADDRKVSIEFESSENTTLVKETFEAENENPIELQRSGWQAILDHFKEYVEML
ncbi:MAG: SRPBCC domain-containing protein [Paludibacter sp.]|nr:SRPBCC domain-containing protein [Paludibacter sp.]